VVEILTTRNKFYILFTLPVTWLFWWQLAYLTQSGAVSIQNGLGLAIYIIGGTAPTVGAYFAVLKTKEAGSVSEFNKRVLNYRYPSYYYLYAIGVPLLLGLAGLIITYIFNNQKLLDLSINNLVLFIPAFIGAIIFGGLEEFGWRGIFQHEMKGKMSLFNMNFGLGLLWGVWHLPLFYVVGTAQYGNSIFFFVLAGIGYSAFLTWLYAKTDSILLCVLFHAAINSVSAIGLYVPMSNNSLFAYYALFVLISGLLFLKATEKVNNEGVSSNSLKTKT
jgi:membrane protease YdiL (CAAX protease family)